MKSSPGREKPPKAKIFPTQLQSRAGLEAVEWEGVLEDGKLAPYTLASSAQGMRDLPRHEHPAPSPSGQAPLED